LRGVPAVAALSAGRGARDVKNLDKGVANMHKRNATSRRDFIAGMAAAAIAARSFAAGPGSRSIIDVHAHFQSPALRPFTPGPMAAWSLATHLEQMDMAGVTRSLLSVTTPGIPAKGEQGAKLARDTNDYAAQLVADNRGKLGFFTAVPMDDMDLALREIAYGFDSLHAQGVGLFTSYDGIYLGDPRFDPVFAELNRRKAIVYVHPSGPACCSRIIPEVADMLIEYGTDTTRAIASYIYRGAARRYPAVRMIWSHSGGTMPYLIERFDGADRGAQAKAAAPDGFRASAGRFFYEIAQASNPVATRALRAVVPLEHIVFGTDYPFRTPIEHVKALDAGGVFSAAELEGIYRQHVAKLLPELV
jgi:predicted TIM-barrel fold metal-dependent hydrolase